MGVSSVGKSLAYKDPIDLLVVWESFEASGQGGKRFSGRVSRTEETYSK